MQIVRHILEPRIGIPWLFVGISFIFCMWHIVDYRVVRGVVERYEQERQQRQVAMACDEDEGVDSETEEVFTIVNRTPDYLRDRAIKFARNHDMGESVKLLYSSQDPQVFETQKRTKKKSRSARKNIGRKRQISDADIARWTAQPQKEPLFDLPIDKGSFWLSSPFGMRRKPGGGRGFHFGIDMAAVHGTPVKAAGNGVVVQACYQAGYGNVVVIKHDGKFKTRYAHLSKILCSVGGAVKAGMVIGKVGRTGNTRSSGKTRDSSHLHFEVELDGKRVNPFCFFK